MDRRMLQVSSLLLMGWVSLGASAKDRPNVLLVITDDLGYGDLGIQGNSLIETPTIDRIAKEGLRHDPFYVCPVCTPTRASLMTGRYHLRTGAIDTYLGRAIMDPREVTLAEMLKGSGYRTAIFGKWHLGDSYPSRSIDQGFEESLVHRGGGLAQNSGPPGETYFDPELVHNGVDEKSHGYCTDIFADAAADFVRAHSKEPWFVYLAFNAPHDPLQVPEESLAPYRDKSKGDERVARIYAMIAHLDRALGRVIRTLEDTGTLDRTIVLFLSDNGGTGGRFAGGLRGTKGSVYEGGLRSPFFVRYPSCIQAGSRRSEPGAHIDVVPTLLAACGVERPKGVAIDGIDLWKYWSGEVDKLHDRALFFQYHRGNAPVRYRSVAVRKGPYKLIQPVGFRSQPFDVAKTAFSLYDLAKDPGEEHDLGMTRGDLVVSLREKYEAWFDDVSTSRGFAPVRIVVGSSQEPTTRLSRQDWRVKEDESTRGAIGQWELEAQSAGTYRFVAEFEKAPPRGSIEFRVGDQQVVMKEEPDSRRAVFETTLPAGPISLSIKGGKPKDEGPWFVYISKLP